MDFQINSLLLQIHLKIFPLLLIIEIVLKFQPIDRCLLASKEIELQSHLGQIAGEDHLIFLYSFVIVTRIDRKSSMGLDYYQICIGLNDDGYLNMEFSELTLVMPLILIKMPIIIMISDGWCFLNQIMIVIKFNSSFFLFLVLSQRLTPTN